MPHIPAIYYWCREKTKCGHFLEKPESRSKNPQPERNLSSKSNTIMRILLHAVCVWTVSSNNKVFYVLKGVTREITV